MHVYFSWCIHTTVSVVDVRTHSGGGFYEAGSVTNLFRKGETDGGINISTPACPSLG
jgi:hypothetical protein